MWNTVGTCLLSSWLFAGISLKLSGEEVVLLGHVSAVSRWCDVLLMETVQELLESLEMRRV